MSEEKCIFKTSHPYFKKGAESCRIHTQPCSDISFMCHKNCTFYKMAQENRRLREALKKINTSIINDFAFNDKPYISMINGLKNIAKQALGA